MSTFYPRYWHCEHCRHYELAHPDFDGDAARVCPCGSAQVLRSPGEAYAISGDLERVLITP